MVTNEEPSQGRYDKYRDAIWGQPSTHRATHAVMAVADAEQAELRARNLEMAERHSEHLHDAIQRAEAAEAKVARVEALIGNWEAAKGAPESEAWAHYVAERVRNALSGDYSSEALDGDA